MPAESAGEEISREVLRSEVVSGDGVVLAHPSGDEQNSTAPHTKDPKWGTRAPAPGARGCWALKKDGSPCSAARRMDGDYCNAHSGVGVSGDPAKYQPLATARAGEARARRAELRVILGSTRVDSPRTVLRAAAMLNAERLASSAINAATDPSIDPSKRGAAALAVIEAAEPRVQTQISMQLDPSDMSLSQLMERAEALGITPQPVDKSLEAGDEQPPAGAAPE